MEAGHGWSVVLTGSNARKLKRSDMDLLAGRAIVKTMYLFMAAESGEAFDLGEALERGTVPFVVDSTTPREALQAYAALNLREEVQMEGLAAQHLRAWNRDISL